MNHSTFSSLSVFLRYPNIDLTIGVAFRHPVHGLAVFILGDMPHLVKKVVNCLELTGGRGTERDLRRRHSAVGPDNPTALNLGMIKEAWVRSGGGVLGALRIGKLTSSHFPPKEPRSRMRVNLATQVLSMSVVRMFEDLIGDPAVQVRRIHILMSTNRTLGFISHILIHAHLPPSLPPPPHRTSHGRRTAPSSNSAATWIG